MTIGGRDCRNISVEAVFIAVGYAIVTIYILVGPLTRYRKMAQETECNTEIDIFEGSLEKCLDGGLYLKKSKIGDIYSCRA